MASQRLPHDPRQVSSAPTLPGSTAKESREFDIRDLYSGPAAAGDAGAPAGDGAPLDEKFRQAYFWIVNHAIITPHYDIEFNSKAPRTFRFAGAGSELRLPTEQSYSSFVLLPLLTFAARRRALFIGGPGRGKTASAILMGLLAGYKLSELRRAIQHGQPQMTIADLLGNPLPRTLIEADDMEHQADKVGEHIDETRRDWEAKEEDASVPGAQPDPGEEEEPVAGAEVDEETVSEEGGP